MRVYIEVYGCTANKSDASLIRGLLKQNNHKLTNQINEADVIILLTCTVIGTTEQRMLSRLREFKKFGKKIIVTGCMASIQSELVKSITPNAQLIPTGYSHHIIDVIENNKLDLNINDRKIGPKDFNGISAPISIAEGCMFSCSYCITSPARGKLISFTKDEIIKDIYCALKQNCKEIQLTSQDTASYGLDINSNLGELLSNLSDIKGDYRIRVGMMNPFTALKNLNSILKGFKNNNIYKFLHLPVQSGDNNILHLMDRKYTVKNFIKIVGEFNNKYPDITLSTDIIVGFPNETDEQFYNSVNLIEKIKPDIVNVTRFSARPHTKAKNMKGRINTKIAKERSKILAEISELLSIENNKKCKGKIYNTLITKRGKKDTYIGRTDNYKPVLINEKADIGKFVNLEIIDSDHIHLFGKLI